jgi:hypothetical protein
VAYRGYGSDVMPTNRMSGEAGKNFCVTWTPLSGVDQSVSFAREARTTAAYLPVGSPPHFANVSSSHKSYQIIAVFKLLDSGDSS